MLAQVATEVEPFLDVKTILLLLGVVTPFVTAVLTKAGASEGTKAAVSAVVIALVALVTTGLSDGSLTWEKWLNGSIQILAAHLATWLMAGKLVAKTNDATANVGVGPAPAQP